MMRIAHCLSFLVMFFFILGLSTSASVALAATVHEAAALSSRFPPSFYTAQNAVGKITEFPLPFSNSLPYFIAPGSDGNLWFTEYGAYQIGRITPSGVITEFPLPSSGGTPFGIASGPDHNIWFTTYSGSQIGRITPDGTVTEFPLSNPNAHPLAITPGPKKNKYLWFSEVAGNNIGRIST